MKKKDLSTQKKEDLIKLLEEKRENIKDFNFKSVSGGVKDTKRLREDKKDIARILTILNKK
ncbi:MAG: 50S ribosomal protein L29 [Candidatus Pacebacteria bacterium]|nr:50S ribosomal protein L29 [Candidatus Paceibacterota bacterium]MDD4074180.1 50S ribosomal protein L29 [Candidatus Paceibacterota bacterium]